MRQSQRILAVVNDRALYQKVEKLLGRSTFEVNRVPSGAGALILVGNLRYDLILVEAPLPDLDLQDFIAAVRTLDSPCSGSSVVLLSRDDNALEVSEAMLEDRVSIAPASADANALQITVSEALGVAARASARLLVQLSAEIDDGSFKRMTQTANISETGMLLTGAPMVPIGTRVNLTFELPEAPGPLEVSGEVVRHTQPEIEQVSGIGVRFDAVSPEAAEQLREFLEVRLRSAAADDEASDEALDTAAPSGA